jgi:DNA mismatch repair ATPase MutS
MNVHLMHHDRDFDPDRELPSNSESLTADLGLDMLLTEMAVGDPYLYKVAQTALLSSITGTNAILYRQSILSDCLQHPNLARELYELTVQALEAEKSIHFGFVGLTNQYPDSTLHSAVEILKVYTQQLEHLRQFTDDHAHKFAADGLTEFFAMIQRELDDEYLQTVRDHLAELGSHGGVTVSAQLGEGANPVRYLLHRRRHRKLTQRIASLASRSEHVYRVADRDEQGARMLGEMRGRAINETANATAQSAEHIRAFFKLLRAELAFYIAALNLHERLTDVGEPTCFPQPLDVERRTIAADGLYEPCLTLRIQARVIGNDLDTNKPLLVITGANQGGKSTFLRSVGIAQLMMQCGLFVAADSFTANVCRTIFTHFRRGEDTNMESGKLDEELARMSEIADNAQPNSLVLCNESFAATNEHEGSQIAQQIITALIDSDIQVALVTHMYDLASGLHHEQAERAMFLRAERQPDRTRTFRLREAEPLPTSYGPDVFARIFGSANEVRA